MKKNDYILHPLIDDSYFYSYRNQHNIHRIKILIKPVIAFECIFLALAFLSYFSSPVQGFSYIKYIFMYCLMILLSLASGFYFKQYTPKQNSLTHERRYYIFSMFFAGLFILWGAVVSLFDQPIYGNLNAFFVNIVVIMALLNFKTTHTLQINIFVTAILYILMPFTQNDMDLLLGNYVNGTVFVTFIIIASILQYNQFCARYIEEKALKDQIIENIQVQMSLQRKVNQLEEDVLQDSLTQLPNRRGLDNYITRIENAHLTQQLSVVFIMIDIDYFKKYNDYYGHIKGDEVLKHVATTIQSHVRGPNEFSCRFGGEEFLFIGVAKSLDDAYQIAESIRKDVLNLKIKHDGSDISQYVTVSLGIHRSYVKDLIHLKDEINRADQALYHAKQSGKNKIYV